MAVVRENNTLRTKLQILEKECRNKDLEIECLLQEDQKVISLLITFLFKKSISKYFKRGLYYFYIQVN